jgi:1-acyl-sn-glycerol-3-phosphate acyltransferase
MSWRLPPRWVRRVVLAPAIVVLAVVLVPTSLLLVVFLLGALTWLVPGRLRVPRMLWMASFYILWDAAVLVAAFGLWVASGFGWFVQRPAFRSAHYRLADRMLTVLFWQVRWTLRLDIEVVDADLGVVLTGTPIVVASRHAGPGDSFILVHALLSWFDRNPRIVLKDTLQWDPAIDVLLNRLPAQFVTPRGSRRAGAAGGADAVGRLATDLGPRDALLIFPEGGNVTPRRRLARIEALRSAGRHRLAADAEQMRNVMAPHSGGILSALDEAPQAGVVFVAHTGLDRLVTVADVWRELPMDKRIVMKGWSVPADEVPRERVAQEEWLFASWLRIDEWITEHELPAALVVPPPDEPEAAAATGVPLDGLPG